jgi:hypothetical protein
MNFSDINKSLTSIEEILEKFGRIELARRVVTKGLSLQAVYEKQKEEADGLASSMTGGDEEDDLATTAEEGTFGSDDDSHDSLKEDSTLATSSENRTESEGRSTISATRRFFAFLAYSCRREKEEQRRRFGHILASLGLYRRTGEILSGTSTIQVSTGSHRRPANAHGYWDGAHLSILRRAFAF